MSTANRETADPVNRLTQLLAAAGLQPLDAPQLRQFADYLALLLRWNSHLNLTAIRDSDGILSRHFVESIAAAVALPSGLTTLLDFGSGAGLPGIPIAICRPEIAVTLAESQNKKAAFLQEAVRTLGLEVRIHPGRAEILAARFGCVTLRAVDKMESAVAGAAKLVQPGGWLAPMTTHSELPALQGAAGPAFSWSSPVVLPGGDQRILALGRNSASLD